MQQLPFILLPLLMFVFYLALMAGGFYFIYYLVNKSHQLRREQNDLLRELISRIGEGQGGKGTGGTVA